MKGKGRMQGRLGRVTVALLLSIMMTVTFIPTSVFAETASPDDNDVQTEQDVDAQNSGGDGAGMKGPAAVEEDEGQIVMNAKGENDPPNGEGEPEDSNVGDDDESLEMWFENDPTYLGEEDVVYSDGYFTYILSTTGLPDGADIDFEVIKGNGDALEEEKHFSINNDDGLSVILDGQALSGDHIQWVKLRATASRDGEVICRTYDEDNDNDWKICRVSDTVVDYHYRDYEMLPGWEDWINGYDEMYVENSKYPSGGEVGYEVTAVEVTEGASLIGEGLDDDGKSLIKDDDDDDFGYGFRIKSLEELNDDDLPGEIEFEVSYETVGDEDDEEFESEQGSFTFTVTVRSAIYRANMWAVEDLYQGLPGDEIALQADASKEFIDEEDHSYQRTDEGLVYHWEIEEGSAFAAIEPDEDDPSTAVLKFKENMPENWNPGGERVKVKMFVSDANDEDDNERASAGNEFWVSSEYWQIEPTGAAIGLADLDVGCSEPIEPKVFKHEVGEEPVEVSDVSFKWRNVDDSCVTIDDGETEGTFIITRTDSDGTNFCLAASPNGEGNWHAEQWYHLNEKEYDMWFESDPAFKEVDDIVYDDGDFTYTLMTESLPEEAAITYTVKRDNGDPLPEGCCDIAEDDEGNLTFTLHGAVLAAPENNVRWVQLRAEASIGGQVICTTYDEEDDNDWTVCTVYESCVDYHHEDIEMLPGWDYWIDGYNDMYVENTAHPSGDNIAYKVTGVKITKGANLIGEGLSNDGTSLKKDGDDYSFRIKEPYELNEDDIPGIIKVEVSYETVGDDGDEEFESETGTFSFKVSVVFDVYELDIDSDDGRYEGLPGDEFDVTVNARHKYIDRDGRYQEDAKGLTYKWYYVIGSDMDGDDWDGEPGEDDWTEVPEGGLDNHPVAGLTTDQNEAGQPTGHLTFKSLVDEQEDDEVYLRVEAFSGDDMVCSEEVSFQEHDDYCTLFPKQIENLVLENSTEVSAEVHHRWMENNTQKDETLDDVHFYWEYDESVLTVKDAGGVKVGNYDDEGHYNGSEASVGRKVKFTITRHGTDGSYIQLIGKVGDNENKKIDCEYWLDRIENGLWDYEIRFKSVSDNGRLFGDFSEDEVVVSEEEIANEIEVAWNDYVLDPKYYDLTIQYEHWIDEDDTEMIDVNELTYHGANKSTYKVTAKAKEIDGNPFEGETNEFWVDICSNTSLAGADITFPEKDKGFALSPMVDYYWFTAGETSAPVVTINGGEPLVEGDDYVVSYIDENDEESNSFPTTSGEYTCRISPAEGSQYSDGYDRTVLVVLTEDEMRAAEAAIQEGEPVFNKVERFFDENCTKEYKQKVRAEYDALSDDAKAWTPAQLKYILHEETGCFWYDSKVETEATCTANGVERFTCTYCGNTKDKPIPATGHKWEKKTDPAYMFTYGRTYEKCSVCHSERNEVAIVEGTAPSFVKGLKVKKAKKAFTVKWKKQSKKNLKKFNGYQIRYALNQNELDNAKIWNVGKKKKSKKFKVAAKTSYVVQIRTFTVSGGNTYYSDWKTKTVKTK